MSTVSSTSSLNGGFGLGVSGLESGFDWHSLITELVTVEREPETQLQAEQTTINNKNTALAALVTDLTTLQTDVTTLNDPTLYEGATAASSSSIATVSAGAGTATGAYTFDITQLATAASVTGASNLNGPLNSSSDVSSLVLSSANFSTPVTAGTFSVNGHTVTIATTDTLQSVFDKIYAATGETVTGTYDPTADKITLTNSSNSPITLGSSADTSNFLQVAGLYTSSTGTVSSTTRLGAAQTTMDLDKANLATPISDGGNGQGAFTINGVTINFDASTDSLQDVLDAINASAANVTATYDSLNNSVTLTNNNTGNTAITVEDVTGNFMAATGLSTGKVTSGTNLTYTINGGTTPITSLSNAITPQSSGITGLTVTAMGTGSTTVTVASNTSAVETAISQFVTDYNTVQNLISTDIAVTTDSSGNVTPGVLTGDDTVESIATTLRSMVFSPVSGLNGAVTQLSALGYDTNSTDNTLALTDSSALQNALSNNMNDVKAFFTTATTGVAAQFNTYLGATVGGPESGVEGTLPQVEDTLTAQSQDITTQIAAIETRVTADQTRMVNEFTNMEQIRSQLNTDMTYLQASFGVSGSTSATGVTSSSSSS
jgi:flagellar hook-associated protein 2